MRRYKYNVGGYCGDQLDALVSAMLLDAEKEPNGLVRLRELVAALTSALNAPTGEHPEREEPPVEPV